MKHILSLAFALESYNFDEEVEFNGQPVRITQLSTNFDLELTKNLIKKYDGEVDVIALSGLPPSIKYRGGEFVHPQGQFLKTYARETPIVDGQLLKDVYLPWAMRQFYLENSQLLYKKRIGVYCGAVQKNIIETLNEFENKLVLADPYYVFKLPKVLNSSKTLDTFLKFFGPVLKKIPLKRSNVSRFEMDGIWSEQLKEFFDCDVFVGNLTTLNLLDKKHLAGKTLIIDFAVPEILEEFKEVGVSKVISCLPNLGIAKFVNYPIFEAILLAFGEDKHILSENDIIKWVDKLKLTPKITELNEVPAKDDSKFAFVIHPLSTKQLFYHPQLKFLSKFSKPLESITEELIAMAPGFFYGKIKGIKSEKNGKEIEGLIYTATETPRKLMEKNPEVIYKKLVKLTKQADKHGAKIVGLGAYTKIVGDAGVTVSKRSPIPVTTGNSLSAASTLWAAKYAIEKMGLVESHEGIHQGTTMIVGATGSIGAVSAKILAQKWKRVILVAPRAYKLLELKDQIAKIAPNCQVDVATNPNEYLNKCDLVITTTSSRGKKILDIENVRPGCVICDVSRPFDISEKDALSRPDVMVIASGEVTLPGNVEININLGLEGNVVYACLAETALLALEGRYESFTLSRNISYQKVLEIDQMAKEHGVRLSAIMGHSGVVTDDEFELCRKHALSKLNNQTIELRP